MRRRFQQAAARQNYLLGVSALAEMASSLLRTIVLARILAPDQFGIVVAITLTLSLAEGFSEIGLDRMILRLKGEPDMPTQRGAMHSLGLLRGVLLALVLAALAPFLAVLFRAPEATGAFLVLAICPLIRGWASLGPKEQTRDYVYGPDAIATLALHGGTLVATVLVALILRNFWAAPIGLIAGLLFYAGTTHILSVHPWRLRWHGPTAREALVYGAPLVPNGLASGLKAVGDRLVVGALLGPATLAYYNLTMMIGLLPRTIALRYLSTVFMPRFVNVERGREAEGLAGAFALLVGLIGLVMGLGLWSVGAPVVGLVFGAAYTPPQSLAGATGVLIAIRLLYAAVTMPAMAFGSTSLILIGSAGSLAGAVLGALGLWLTRDLTVFVFVMAAAEFAGLIIARQVGRKALELDSTAAGFALVWPVVLVLGLVAVEWATGLMAWPLRCALAFLALALYGGAAAWMLRRNGGSVKGLAEMLRRKPPSGLAPPPLPPLE